MSSFFKKHASSIAEDVSHRGSLDTRPTPYDGRRRLDRAAELDLDRIEADPQHREVFEEESLMRLARSLKEHGQMQPIRVRWSESRSKYIIIAGERRFRAAALAGLPSIQAIIVEGELTESQIIREQVIENALREDLRPTEQGKAFKDLMEANGFNGKELASYLHVAPSTISRRIAVLELSDELQEKVDSGELSIKDAIATAKTETNPKRKRKPKPSRERKIAIAGFTVTVKSRRIITDELLEEALHLALDACREEKREAA